MKGKKIVRRRRKIIVAPRECSFCKDKKEPLFFETEVLRRFTTEREKIIPRSRSGLCTKDQRKLTLAIKHARHLAILPFVGHH